MPTNKEWLFSLSLDELYAWFDAEHVENQNGTLDGARAALNDELRLDATPAAEVDEKSEHVQKLDELDSRENLGSDLGSGSQVGSEVDSREKLEADVLKWCGIVHLDGFLQDMVIGWLDRQAAITEREKAEKCKEAERERELYRARVSDLLDAIQEAWRVGQREYTLVDMDGEVVS